MTRLRAAGAALAATIRAVLVPESDAEAAVIFGLSLVAAGFLAAEQLGSIVFAPLALLVPGAVYVLVGLGFGRRS